MGFFDKMKKMVGKTGVKLEYKRIETPFTFTDPMIKATIVVKAEGEGVTVLGTTGILMARRVNDDGQKEQIILGKEVRVANKNHTTTRNGESVPVFPHLIEGGSEESFGYFVGSRNPMNLKESLAKWGVDDAESAKIKKVTFFFIGEVDIEETVGAFDPKLEHEIEVR